MSRSALSAPSARPVQAPFQPAPSRLPTGRTLTAPSHPPQLPFSIPQTEAQTRSQQTLIEGLRKEGWMLKHEYRPPSPSLIQALIRSSQGQVDLTDIGTDDEPESSTILAQVSLVHP